MRSHFIALIALLFATPTLSAFTNGNFEAGTLAGWTVEYGTGGGVGSGYSAALVTPGNALNTNNGLNQVHSGAYACMLDSGSGGLSAHDTWARIKQADVISSTNAVLEFWYAAVLDGSHAASDDAYVQIDLLDGAGGTIYTVQYAYATSPAPLIDDNVPLKKHLPWTKLNFDLSAYIGQTVTFQFTAYDCAFSGHNSVAYVDDFKFMPPTPTFTPTSTISPTFTVTETATISPTFTVSPTLTTTPEPLVLHLYPPSPHPATGDEVWLPFYIAADSWVSIDMFTIAGEPVRQLERVWMPAGVRERRWDLQNSGGNKVASGIFLYRVSAESAIKEFKSDWSKCAVAR